MLQHKVLMSEAADWEQFVAIHSNIEYENFFFSPAIFRGVFMAGENL